MFDNIKKLHQLKKMQDEFKKETITVEKRGVKITMNGNFGIDDVMLNAELSLQDQQNSVKDAINEAREKIQRQLAQKMMSSGMSL